MPLALPRGTVYLSATVLVHVFGVGSGRSETQGGARESVKYQQTSSYSHGMALGKQARIAGSRAISTTCITCHKFVHLQI